MFKIHLYREYFDKRAEARRRSLRTALCSGLIGLEVLMIGFLMVSGLLLGEQVREQRNAIARLSSRVQKDSASSPELELARELARVKAARVDWSPKLAALSHLVEPSVRLDRLTGQVPGKKTPARLELDGWVSGQDDPLSALSRFVDGLQRTPAFERDFPMIQLETIREAESGRFTIICGPAGEAPRAPR